MNKSDNEMTLKNILLIILFLLLLAIPTYFAYTILFPRVEIFEQEEVQEEEDAQEIKKVNTKEESIEEEEKEEVLTIECQEGEMIERVRGDIAYVSFPKSDPTNQPHILIYGHGSTTFLSEDFNNEDMQDIKEFAEFFNQSNFIFIALEQNYEDWDRERSEINTKRIVDSVNDSCDTSDQIYLLGYSKGGSPTLNFASVYPNNVEKVALLAPTIKFDEWDEDRVKDVMDIEFKIWHGDMDINIPLYKTQDFVDYLEENGKQVDFVVLNGIDHWYPYDNYMPQVLDYFLSN